ncbi:hypothetical protein BGZ83_004434, partial [Gryganskiella cystojenkinii]
MRFKYWNDQRWGSKYENAAKKTVRDAWFNQYAEDTSQDPTQPFPDHDDEDVELALLGFTNNRPKGDELEEFVSGPTVRETPLAFWKKNCESYPQLTKMARDFFAIPATSAPSE